jgi:tRNA(Ile)-lysidine synthase
MSFSVPRRSLPTENRELIYHFPVHGLTERALQTIRKRELLRAGDRLAVAVSGGADSVALLRVLLEVRAELGIVLSVAHVNHKLRARESDEDEEFVTGLARQHGLDLHLCTAPAAKNAGTGVEGAAREARYRFFRELAKEGRITKIATAHTLDDQAETVLLRIFRGTGIRGLSGIHPQIVLEEGGRSFGEIVRPLLGFRRADLLSYLREQGQSWREDSSNRSLDFLRNRVRHQLVPLIAEDFGQAAIEHMSELAEIARAEEEHWLLEHRLELPQVRTGVRGDIRGAGPQPAAALPVRGLLALSLAAQRRLVRGWITAGAPEVAISFRRIEEVLDAARGPAGRRLAMSAGWNVRRARQELVLEKAPLAGAADYQYVLPLPGAVEVKELNLRLEAKLVNGNDVPGDQAGQLLDPARLPEQVVIRNWRAGDRFWPAHTAAEKKVKDLLSDRHLTGQAKKLWPVAVGEDGTIVWMRSFSVPESLGAPAGSRAIWIREIAP